MRNNPRTLIGGLVVLLIVIIGIWIFFSALTPPAFAEFPSSLPFAMATETAMYKITLNVPASGNEALDQRVRSHVIVHVKDFSRQHGTKNMRVYEGIRRKRWGAVQIIEGSVWKYKTLSALRIDERQNTFGKEKLTIKQYVYDDEGRPVALRDLFAADDYLERISTIVRPRFNEELAILLENGEVGTEDLEDIDAKIEPSDQNYGAYEIIEQGFIFYFGEYIDDEKWVTPLPAIQVPFSELQDILSPEYF